MLYYNVPTLKKFIFALGGDFSAEAAVLLGNKIFLLFKLRAWSKDIFHNLADARYLPSSEIFFLKFCYNML